MIMTMGEDQGGSGQILVVAVSTDFYVQILAHSLTDLHQQKSPKGNHRVTGKVFFTSVKDVACTHSVHGLQP